MSRFIFGEEPVLVMVALENDPDFGTDRLASAILEFSAGQQSVFVCGTQTAFYQRMHFLGSDGRVEIEIPWNAPNDRPTRIFVGGKMSGEPKVEEFSTCDQYTIQGDEFSRAIRGEREVPVPMEDAIGNMVVIDAVFRAGKSGRWERPEKA
jgi:predicted dehydrogenase